MSASGQLRRFGDVSDWSAYISFAVELVRCNELTRCATSGSHEVNQFLDPALGMSLQYTELTRLQAKHHAAGYFELYRR